jgi:hypothetical protein
MEYLLMLSVITVFGVSRMVSLPKDVFARGGTKLAARVESHLATGQGFLEKGNGKQSWAKQSGQVEDDEKW